MEQSPPQGPPRRSTLEAVMSLRYDECNIIAAEASKLAYEEVAAYDETKTLYVLDETRGEIAEVLQTAPLVNVEGIEQTYVYKAPKLLLARTKNGDVDPRLLAVVRDDLAVPIATFARRKDGSCSYVQLGQEISDENFVVTPYDKRKDTVKHIRSLFSSQKQPVEGDSSLRELVSSQILSQAEAIKLQLAPALWRLAQSQYDTLDSRVTKLRMLTAEGPIEQTMRTVFLSPYMLGDGRRVELFLASPPDNGLLRKVRSAQETQLLMVTRENVALPVVRFTKNGEVLDADSGEPLNTRAVGCVREAIFRDPPKEYKALAEAQTKYSPNKLVRKTHKLASKDPKSESLGATKALIDYCDPESQIKVAGIELVGRALAEYDDVISTIRMRTQGSESLIDYGLGKILYGGYNWQIPRHAHRLWALAAARHNLDVVASRARGVPELASDLGADSRFEEYLGQYNPSAEALLVKLGHLAQLGTTFSGELKQVVINRDTNTDGNVRLFANIESQNGAVFALNIDARPDALDGFETENLFRAQIDTAKPIGLPPEDINEIRYLLGALSVR